MESAKLVEKEIIETLKFPSGEVLVDDNKIETRKKELKKALSLGNLNKVKVKITFEDDECLKQVDTTIWAITEKNIVLKAGRIIPIHRIHQLSFL
ncbi:MAG: hypothetical protein ACPGLV_06540 [Bacteroidia bacterium]